MDAADVAFIGTALPAAAPENDYPNATNASGQLDAFADRTLRFRVELIFKGEVLPEQEIATPGQGGACGLATEPGSRYLVFGTDELQGLWLSPAPGQYAGALCNGTREATLDERPDGFPRGTRPAGYVAPRPEGGDRGILPESDDSKWIGVVVVWAGLAAATGLVIVLALRRRH